MKKNRKKRVSGKNSTNAKAQDHRTANDKQFEGPSKQNKHFNPTRPENVGSNPTKSFNDAKRKAAGIGTPTNFGSWCAPNRRLNPRNKEDAKIIKRGYDSIYINKTNPSCARGTIDSKKYSKNYDGIDWGEDEKKKKDGKKFKKKY